LAMCNRYFWTMRNCIMPSISSVAVERALTVYFPVPMYRAPSINVNIENGTLTSSDIHKGWATYTATANSSSSVVKISFETVDAGVW